jgi:hypothetical protein
MAELLLQIDPGPFAWAEHERIVEGLRPCPKPVHAKNRLWQDMVVDQNPTLPRFARDIPNVFFHSAASAVIASTSCTKAARNSLALASIALHAFAKRKPKLFLQIKFLPRQTASFIRTPPHPHNPFQALRRNFILGLSCHKPLQAPRYRRSSVQQPRSSGLNDFDNRSHAGSAVGIDCEKHVIAWHNDPCV